MFSIEGPSAADRQTNTMNGKRPTLAKVFQVTEQGAAINHVVLCMYLKEPATLQELEWLTLQLRSSVDQFVTHARQRHGFPAVPTHDCRTQSAGKFVAAESRHQPCLSSNAAS